MKRTRAGFTLLEMLVAIAIFASLALMAQQVTNGVTRVNSAVADHDQKLNLMQQTMSFLTHDLTQMMPRPVRGDQGQREPALLAGAGVLASESEGMRFVRGGVVNPLMRLPRSNLLTVGYRIHDGYLERLAWPLTDAAGSVKPTMQKLIPADSLRLQFYDGTRWQESWSSVQAIPVAVSRPLGAVLRRQSTAGRYQRDARGAGNGRRALSKTETAGLCAADDPPANQHQYLRRHAKCDS